MHRKLPIRAMKADITKLAVATQSSTPPMQRCLEAGASTAQSTGLPARNCSKPAVC